METAISYFFVETVKALININLTFKGKKQLKERYFWRKDSITFVVRPTFHLNERNKMY